MHSIFSPRITQHLVAPEINILMESLDANIPSYDGNLQSFDQSTARSPITGIICSHTSRPSTNWLWCMDP